MIVAHPDDIEWGIAGAVAAWTAAGKEVSYVLVTAGEAGIDSLPPAEARVAREAEERASGAIVGVSEIEFLGHPDGRVVEDLDLRRDIAAAIRRHRPDVVVAQHFGERWGAAPGSRLEQRGPPRRRAGDDGRRRRRRQPLDLPRPRRGAVGRRAVDRHPRRPVARHPRRRRVRHRRHRRAVARRPRAVPARARRHRPGGVRDGDAGRPDGGASRRSSAAGRASGSS